MEESTKTKLSDSQRTGLEKKLLAHYTGDIWEKALRHSREMTRVCSPKPTRHCTKMVRFGAGKEPNTDSSDEANMATLPGRAGSGAAHLSWR
jgi:hypothetical protein